ncbi:MAG: hypothetical protein ABI852_15950 [Gemmatimonadaceae bacterium]
MGSATIARHYMALGRGHCVAGQRIIEIREVLFSELATVHFYLMQSEAQL